VIAEGAQMVGDVVAEELTINGHVKGAVHANRVRLGRTGVVEGDIFHRTLAIEENARFEGMSRRNENAIDTQSFVQANHIQTQTSPIDRIGKGNGTSASLNPASLAGEGKHGSMKREVPPGYTTWRFNRNREAQSRVCEWSNSKAADQEAPKYYGRMLGDLPASAAACPSRDGNE
jgi:Polymer-forming cytoskeletal